MTRIYADGNPSTVGTQLRTDHYYKKALIDAKQVRYFGQLADTLAMPKNMGKKIKRFHYLPILDDRNVNDQGVDAAGVTLDPVKWYAMISGAAVLATAGYATLALAEAAIATAASAAVATPGYGNVYGSSKDVGTIASRMPALSENGGDVNKISNTRIEIEGTFEKFGFYDKYTKESLDFDTDAELEMHVTREMVTAAEQLNEAQLQSDLLAGAATQYFGGDATSIATINGKDALPSVIDYADLMKLEIALDNNLCPKNTKVITGTRMVDTRTAQSARFLYIGSELIPMVKGMVDTFGNAAFIPSHMYAAGSPIATGEIGMIGAFKLIVVPQMQSYEFGGATVATNAGGFRTTTRRNAANSANVEKFDVFPMLVVGSGSFSTIGFQTDGKTVKFSIKHVKPETEAAYGRDVYGESGFTSIKWYYGSIILRSEWLGVAYTVATI